MIINGTINDDTLTGGASDETIIAGIGNDTLDGGAGNDILAGDEIIINSNIYLFTNAGTWEQAQAQARSLGGNLVTINSQAEQQLLTNAFGTNEFLWIGLTDKVQEGNFQWISGETSTYRNFLPGEPNNFNGDEDYVTMNLFGTNQWVDWNGSQSYRGVLEIQAYDYNGSKYFLTSAATWEQAQQQAWRLGGNLVTINSQAEQDWLVSTFGGNERLWIGLTDKVQEGNFQWISGETSTYRNFFTGEPNDAGGNEDYVAINVFPGSTWNDFSGNQSFRGIVEIRTYDYNGSTYLLSALGTWEEAQAQAKALGGNLVIINSQAEQDWLVSTFGGSEQLWIGLTDKVQEGNFQWISGETSTYLNFAPGQPDNVQNEDYVAFNFDSAGKWNDWNSTRTFRGIIEIKGGNDILNGGAGNDTLLGGAGNDIFRGSSGNDIVNGSYGTDTADYSQLNTTITLLPTGILNKSGGLGTDQLIGIETITANANVSNNTIDASTATGASIIANLQTQTLSLNGVPGVGPFTVVNFDNVRGTSLNDTITGDSQNNQLFGNAGNDIFGGSGGNDTIDGGIGTDTADYSQISTTITLLPTGIVNKGTRFGTDQLVAVETIIANANVSNNTIDASTATGVSITANLQTQTLSVNGISGVGPFTVVNFDDVRGTSLNDTIAGDGQSNQLFGNAGDDIFGGSGGNDTIDGGIGTDTVDYSQISTTITLLPTGIVNKGVRFGTDQLVAVETIIANANFANNTIDASSATGVSITANLQTQSLSVNGISGVGPFTVVNFDDVRGTNLNDTITGDNQNNQLFGNDGNDVFRGSGGNDTLNGGVGTDTADYSQLATNITLLPTGVLNKGSGLGTDQLVAVETIIANANFANNTIDASSATGVSITANLQTQTLSVNGISGVGPFTVVNFDDVRGTNLNDTITGDNQNNQLFGNDGNDVFRGSSGNDTLNGGVGTDTADYSQLATNITLLPTGVLNKGSFGTDQLVAVETIIANAGVANNTIDASSATGVSIIANLEAQSLFVNGIAGVGPFTVVNFDDVRGTSLNDTFTGDSQNNQLIGNGGNDVFRGTGGNDTLNGGVGTDIADYSLLFTSITLLPTGVLNKAGGLGTDQLVSIETIIANARVANNTIDASSATGASIIANLQTQSLTVNGVPGVGPFTVVNFDDVRGTNLNDTITGDNQNNQLFGNGGNDILIGGLGNDILTGGAGADFFVFNFLNEGIDTIKDFEWLEDDKIQVSSVGFGATSLNQFTYNESTGGLFFQGSQFAIIENRTPGFATVLDIQLV